jgi:hypothetical protein
VVLGTKKKVRWLFGFSNGNQEHEVVLVISLLSGKKVIYEEGKEIVNTTSMMNTDFGHGWSSMATRRLYRVEANLTMNGELAFIFSVDGVPYIDFPQKHQLKRTGSSHLTTGRYGDEVTETSASSTIATRRASTGSVSATPAVSRPVSNVTAAKSTHSSISKPSGPSLDPFGGNSSSSFDPFTDDFGSTPAPASSTAHSHQKQSPAAAATVAKPPLVAPKTTLTAAAHRSSLTTKPSAAGLLFDDIPAESSNNNSGGFDAFDSNDPFVSSDPHAENSKQSAFDPFAASVPAPAAPHKPSAPSVHRANSSNDAFDPFGGSTDSFATSHGTAPPSHRGSTLDDFAGLSFVVAPSPVTLPASNRVVTPVPAVEEAPVTAKDDTPKDPWQTNLVDLDLSGKTKEQVRRSSIAGPPLKDLLQQSSYATNINNNSNNNIRGSLNAGFPAANSNDPFGAPPILQATSSNGFPVGSHNASYNSFNSSSNGFRPMSTADSISSMGMAPLGSHPSANMRGGMMMGMPPAAPSVPMNPFSGNSMGGNRPMNGVPPAGNIMGGGMGRSSFIIPPTGSGPGGLNNNQPKSSLDALDWRAMS